MKEIVISLEDLRAMPEYSCSLPTGTTIGKRWRRDAAWARRREAIGALEHADLLPPETRERLVRVKEADPEWMIGEYVDIGSESHVGISWNWAMRAPGSVHRGNL